MVVNFCNNDKIVNVLQNIVKSKKISHAYLFYGEHGVGKKTIARFFANSIFCLKDNAPCGDCSSCYKFLSNSYVDFIEIGKQGFGQSFDVKNVRDLINNSFLKPTESKYKIFLLNNVDLLLPNCSNALLKILEEPPKNVIFLLTATNKHAVLKTILSRCVLFYVSPVKIDSCFKFLKDLKVEFHDLNLKNISNLSLGRIGLAKFYLTEQGEEILNNSKELLDAYFKEDEFEFNYILQNKENDKEFILNLLNSFIARIEVEIKTKQLFKEAEVLKFLITVEAVEDAIKKLKQNANVGLTLAALCCEIFC